MKSIIAVVLAVAATAAFALTAVHRGEIVSRDVKLCVYEAEGKTYTKEIKASQTCPKTIEVEAK